MKGTSGIHDGIDNADHACGAGVAQLFDSWTVGPVHFQANMKGGLEFLQEGASQLCCLVWFPPSSPISNDRMVAKSCTS